MRFRALHLLAFGPFRDRTLRFENDGGLEVVYGPNEAGKSTTRRAVLALLFGVPERTKDGHSVDEVRVGATIEDARGKTIELVRRKGRKNTLLDRNESPVDEQVLAGLVGGMTASAYESAYGLDHETLRKGGAALKVGNGELGETLFSAATGLTGLHGVLVDLRRSAEDLFVPSGSKRPLNEAQRSFTTAKKRAAELATSADKWLEVEKHIERARSELESLRAERASAAEERARARATVEAARSLAGLRARAAELESKLAEMNAALDRLVPSAELLSRSQTIADLQERRGSHLKAHGDRPKLAAELEHAEERARRAKRDVRSAVGDLPAEAHVRKLSLEGASLRERARTVEAHEADARLAVTRAEERTSASREARDASDLQTALDRAQREGDLSARVAAAREQARRARAAAETQLATLVGLDGISLEALGTIAIPPMEIIQSHARAAADLAARMAAATDKRCLLEEEQADAERNMATLRAEGDVPTDAALTSARAERDALWDSLRDSPKAPPRATSQRFERALRSADDVADRLRREASRVTRLLELEANAKSSARKLETARDKERRLADDAAIATRAWETLWASAKISPRSPDEMATWRARFDGVLSAAQRAGETSEAALLLEAAEAAARAALGAALAREGELDAPGESLAALEGRAKRILREHESARAERAAAEDARESALRERDRTARERAAFERDRAEWEAKWASATRALGLDPSASPEEATAALEAASTLSRIEDEADRLRRRLAGIDRDAARFTEEVREVVAKCAPDLASAPPEESCVELKRRVDNAADKRARREALEEQASLTDAQAREVRAERDRAEHALRDLATETAESAESHALALDVRIEELDQRIEHASRDLGGIETGARQFDQSLAVDEAAEAQRQLARVRDLTERYVRARLAASAVARLLERFRKENQGPVLARASALFATLTLGTYAGLEVGFGESDEPVLVAVRDGRKLDTSALSDGTLDQLYLALRVASLERLTAARGPLPLLLDDVLVHFDDQRAAAALAVLADLAKHTQVILFTHHERVVELAKRNISDRDGTRTATVHDLAMLRAP